MDFELLQVESSGTVMDALDKIEKNHLRCVFVTENGKVVGVCSQGDVIRMLLNGGNEYTPLEKIVKPSFMYLRDKDWNKAYELIKSHGITVLPILDDDFRLKDVITLPMILARVSFNTD